MTDFSWKIPIELGGQQQECKWLQDDDGRFHSAIIGDHTYSVNKGDSDLELLDPQSCKKCGSEAGWLPNEFIYCHLCGQKIATHYKDAGFQSSTWPQLELQVPSFPKGKPTIIRKMPRGANFFLALIPRRNKLVAVELDYGDVWTWSRPAQEWFFLGAPTGKLGVPEWSFGLLTIGGQLFYPSNKGTICLNLNSTGPARWDISTEWLPLGAPAALGKWIVTPAKNDAGMLCLAIRREDSAEWTLEPTEYKLEAVEWLSRPVVEDNEIHWFGKNCILHCDNQRHPTWGLWKDTFQPLLGIPPLKTWDNKIWAQGQASGQDGKYDWAFSRVTVKAAAENKIVKVPFFVAGSQCFRLNACFDRAPWIKSDAYKSFYPIDDDQFLIPVCTLKHKEKMAKKLFLLKVTDRTLISSIILGKLQDPIVGELYFGDPEKTSESMEMGTIRFYFQGKKWLQAIVSQNELWLYDPVAVELKTWNF
jgi:hypothetical protein